MPLLVVSKHIYFLPKFDVPEAYSGSTAEQLNLARAQFPISSNYLVLVTELSKIILLVGRTLFPSRILLVRVLVLVVMVVAVVVVALFRCG